MLMSAVKLFPLPHEMSAPSRPDAFLQVHVSVVSELNDEPMRFMQAFGLPPVAHAPPIIFCVPAQLRLCEPVDPLDTVIGIEDATLVHPETPSAPFVPSAPSAPAGPCSP